MEAVERFFVLVMIVVGLASIFAITLISGTNLTGMAISIDDLGVAPPNDVLLGEQILTTQYQALADDNFKLTVKAQAPTTEFYVWNTGYYTLRGKAEPFTFSGTYSDTRQGWIKGDASVELLLDRKNHPDGGYVYAYTCRQYTRAQLDAVVTDPTARQLLDNYFDGASVKEMCGFRSFTNEVNQDFWRTKAFSSDGANQPPEITVDDDIIDSGNIPDPSIPRPKGEIIFKGPTSAEVNEPARFIGRAPGANVCTLMGQAVFCYFEKELVFPVPGTYPITFSADGDERTIQLTVAAEGTIPRPCSGVSCPPNPDEPQCLDCYYVHFDYNNDGLVNDDDAQLLTTYINTGCPVGKACDINNNNELTVADTVALGNIISGTDSCPGQCREIPVCGTCPTPTDYNNDGVINEQDQLACIQVCELPPPIDTGCNCYHAPYDYNNDNKLDALDSDYLAKMPFSNIGCPSGKDCDLDNNGAINVNDVLDHIDITQGRSVCPGQCSAPPPTDPNLPPWDGNGCGLDPEAAAVHGVGGVEPGVILHEFDPNGLPTGWLAKRYECTSAGWQLTGQQATGGCDFAEEPTYYPGTTVINPYAIGSIENLWRQIEDDKTKEFAPGYFSSFTAGSGALICPITPEEAALREPLGQYTTYNLGAGRYVFYKKPGHTDPEWHKKYQCASDGTWEYVETVYPTCKYSVDVQPYADEAKADSRGIRTALQYPEGSPGGTCGLQDLYLRMQLDCDAHHTSWDIKDANGNIVIAEGPYGTSNDNDFIGKDIQLVPGTYTFNHYDSACDGIIDNQCTGGRYGYFTLDRKGTTERLVSSSNYECSLTRQFILGCAGENSTCIPSCSGRNCGSDGCGGSCGTCSGACNAGVCGPYNEMNDDPKCAKVDYQEGVEFCDSAFSSTRSWISQCVKGADGFLDVVTVESCAAESEKCWPKESRFTKGPMCVPLDWYPYCIKDANQCVPGEQKCSLVGLATYTPTKAFHYSKYGCDTVTPDYYDPSLNEQPLQCNWWNDLVGYCQPGQGCDDSGGVARCTGSGNGICTVSSSGTITCEDKDGSTVCKGCATGRCTVKLSGATTCLSGSSPPTASLSVNGKTSITANPGDTLTYAWSSTGGTSWSSTWSTSTACGGSGTWDANTANGGYSFPVGTSQAGCTYTTKYTATNSAGSDTATISVAVNGESSGSNQCTAGAKECVSTTSYRSCSDYNGDGYTEWKTTQCASGKHCEAGTCVADTTPTPSCSSNSDCDNGGTCSSGTCRTPSGSLSWKGCTTDGPGDSTCAGDVCVSASSAWGVKIFTSSGTLFANVGNSGCAPTGDWVKTTGTGFRLYAGCTGSTTGSCGDMIDSITAKATQG